MTRSRDADELSRLTQGESTFILCMAAAFSANATDLIDGHGHSLFSDGRRRVGELAAAGALGRGTLLLLTDHNTQTHFPRLLRWMCRSTVRSTTIVAPAVELSCTDSGVDLHVIVVGGEAVKFRPLLARSLAYYHEREQTRLRALQEYLGSAIDAQAYTRFAASRTPNWTLTERFIRRLIRRGRLAAAALPAIRRGAAIGTDKLSLPERPVTLEEVVETSKQAGAIAFLCHIGDLAALHGKPVVDRLLVTHPTLLIDLSSRPYHRNNAAILRASAVARERLRHGAALHGSDFHDLPKPKPSSHRLRTLLARAASRRIDSLPADILLSHPLLLGPLIAHNDLMRDVPALICDGRTLGEWIDTTFRSRARRTAERMLAATLFRHELGRALLLAAHSKGALHDCRAVGSFFGRQPIEAMAARAIAGDLYAIGWVAAVFEIGQRVGHLALTDRITRLFLQYVPAPLAALYAAMPSNTICETSIARLEHDISYPGAGTIIWRRKGLAAVFANLLRLLLSGRAARVGTPYEEAAPMAHALLGNNASAEERTSWYKELLFDHLAATLILDDTGEDCDYTQLWSKVAVPDVQNVEISPREAYHRRIWLHIVRQESGLGQPLELMVKTRRDFLVGRAYQWRAKGCVIALDTSPWATGRFDYAAAVARLNGSESLQDALVTECRRFVEGIV